MTKQPQSKIESSPYATPSHLRSRLSLDELSRQVRPTSPVAMRTDSAQALYDRASGSAPRMSDALLREETTEATAAHVDAYVNGARPHMLKYVQAIKSAQMLKAVVERLESGTLSAPELAQGHALRTQLQAKLEQAQRALG